MLLKRFDVDFDLADAFESAAVGGPSARSGPRQRRSPGAGAARPSPSKGRSHDQSWFLITTGVGLGSTVTESVLADPSGARTPTVSSPSVK